MQSHQGKAKTEDELRERESEATSDATVEDLEDTQKVSSEKKNSDVGPSPDGALDESREQVKADPV